MITYDNNKFLADGVTLNPDYCPNPTLFFAETLTALANATKDAICRETGAVNDSLLLEIDGIKAQITALESVEDLSNQLASLQQLINSLDSDGDGVVDSLTGIQDVANQAEAAALQAQTDAAAAQAAVAQLTTDLSNVQTAFNTQLAAVSQTAQNALTTANSNTADIASNASDIAANTSELATLRSTVENFDNFDEGAVMKMICAQSQAIEAGLDAAKVAFLSVLSEGCASGEEETPGGSGGVL